MQLLIKTRSVGYKAQAETLVNVAFHFETVKNDFCAHILGDTMEVIRFDSFEVQGLDLLASDFQREGQTIDKARSLTLEHLKGLVRDYIRQGDTLKKGAGLLGARQLVYRNEPGNEALTEERRLQAFTASRVAK